LKSKSTAVDDHLLRNDEVRTLGASAKLNAVETFAIKAAE